jgi:hypothetical protein
MAELTLQDRMEIIDLLHRYTFILDGGENHDNGYGYADLYTEDGSFMGRPAGREELAKAAGRTADGGMSPSGRRGPGNVLHINVNEVIVGTDEGARGTNYLLMIDGPSGLIYWAGWYEDEYAKTPKGWRFKSRNHVYGPKAGMPANHRGMRDVLQNLAREGAGEAPSGDEVPIARDPLKWVDGLA